MTEYFRVIWNFVNKYLCSIYDSIYQIIKITAIRFNWISVIFIEHIGRSRCMGVTSLQEGICWAGKLSLLWWKSNTTPLCRCLFLSLWWWQWKAEQGMCKVMFGYILDFPDIWLKCINVTTSPRIYIYTCKFSLR